MTQPSFFPVAGIRLATAAAGIRYRDREDLCLMELTPGASCAAVFTQNAFCAAPVQLAKRHLAQGHPRYLLINAGNANAGTGAEGLAAAEQCCAALGKLAGCAPEAVLPFSTGVIGEPLPVERLLVKLPEMRSRLSENAWPQAARAIMTTDQVPKLVSRRFSLSSDRSGVITGMAKGAGMICPNLATLLVFLGTDVAIAPELLQAALERAVAQSFNAITIDGDTSTNDACVLVATGTLDHPPLEDPQSPDFQAFSQALDAVCGTLAEEIVRDGEGATKLVTLDVQEAADEEEARQVAYCVAHSPLVKTALFASDPNWGRILAAVGRAGLEGLDIQGVRIWLGETLVVQEGGRAPSYRESAGAAAMAGKEIQIRIALGRGRAHFRLLTCDLSYDYVKINAEYRT